MSEPDARTLASALIEVSNRDVGDPFERFPAQPPPGSVLRFEQHYGQRTYTYLALRVDDRWFLTGQQDRILNWADLVEKIGANACHLVTEYAEIPRPPVDPRDEISDPGEWFLAVYGGDGA